jgi:hypothetical protein
MDSSPRTDRSRRASRRPSYSDLIVDDRDDDEITLGQRHPQSGSLRGPRDSRLSSWSQFTRQRPGQDVCGGFNVHFGNNREKREYAGGHSSPIPPSQRRKPADGLQPRHRPSYSDLIPVDVERAHETTLHSPKVGSKPVDCGSSHKLRPCSPDPPSPSPQRICLHTHHHHYWLRSRSVEPAIGTRTAQSGRRNRRKHQRRSSESDIAPARPPAVFELVNTDEKGHQDLFPSHYTTEQLAEYRAVPRNSKDRYCINTSCDTKPIFSKRVFPGDATTFRPDSQGNSPPCEPEHHKHHHHYTYKSHRLPNSPSTPVVGRKCGSGRSGGPSSGPSGNAEISGESRGRPSMCASPSNQKPQQDQDRVRKPLERPLQQAHQETTPQRRRRHRRSFQAQRPQD